MHSILEIPPVERIGRLRYHVEQLQSPPMCVDPAWLQVLMGDVEVVSHLHATCAHFVDSSDVVKTYHATLNRLYNSIDEDDLQSIKNYLEYLIFFVEEIQDEESLTDMFNQFDL